MPAGRSKADESVAIVGTSATSTINCVRSLGRRGVHTIVVSEDDALPAFSSKYCDESIVVTSPNENLVKYKDDLRKVAQRPDVRTIAPVREPDVYVLAKYRDEFIDHVATPWPSLPVLRDAHDRVRLMDAASKAGVSIPETQLLTDVDDWNRELIVKARYALLADEYVDSMPPAKIGSMAKTIYLEPGEEPDLDSIVAKMGHVPIVQEYVDGTEYTFRGLFDDGEPVVTAQKRLVRGFKYPRGPSVFHEAVHEPDLATAGKTVLDAIDWHGPASVGFIRDDDTGEFKLLEINPRFWASVPCDIHAGVDFPYHYWQFTNGNGEDIDPDYEPGTASHYLIGEAAHLASILREDYPLVERPSFARSVLDVLTSLYEHPRFDCLALDDPKPFAVDVFNQIAERR